MKKYNSLLFWTEYELTSFEFEGDNYLLADEVNCILEDFKLKLSDKVYECEKCLLLLGSVNAKINLQPGNYVSIDMFVPVNCLSDYLTNK